MVNLNKVFFAFLLIAPTAHAKLDCKNLNLDGTWDLSVPRMSVNDSVSYAIYQNQAHIEELHGDDFGTYYQITKEAHVSLNKKCIIEIETRFEKTQSFRTPLKPMSGSSERDQYTRDEFYKMGENVNRYQINEDASTEKHLVMNRLTQGNPDDEERIWDLAEKIK